MKKAHLIIILIYIICFSCNKSPEVKPASFSEVSIEGAKIEYKQVEQRSKVGERKLGTFEPIWENAYYYKFEFGDAVIIPLKYTNKTFVRYSSKETTVNIETLNKLMAYLDNEGKITFKIIRLIPAEQFIVDTHYLTKKAPYSGSVFDLADSHATIKDKIMALLNNGVLRYLSPIDYSQMGNSAFWDNPNTPVEGDGHHGILGSTLLIPTNQ